MKTAILSINLYTRRMNYGAVLHSWFFQKLMLRRDDVSCCDIVDYVPRFREHLNPKLHYIRRRAKVKPSEFVKGLILTPTFMCRCDRFYRFYREHLKISQGRYTRAELEKADLPYDILFFESDVIWSPEYNGGKFDPVYFGALDSMRDMGRVAYSASMGNAYLTEANYGELRALLKFPDYISMRERYAAEIVRGQTDKPVADVIDPVLLADPSDFDEITGKCPVRGRYVLIYNPVYPNEALTKAAERYAKARGFRVVEVSAYVQNSLRRKTFTAARIETFLALVRNAEAVFCNSLHGTCLSILFHREFFAFGIEGGGRKYEDLCGKLGLEGRFCRDAAPDAAPIDWARVDARREELRAESLAWLDEAVRGAWALRQERLARAGTP